MKKQRIRSNTNENTNMTMYERLCLPTPTDAIETPTDAIDQCDEIISFNVVGTIVAVLRSTVLSQAPSSTFASRFSGRWSQQSEELDKDGNILLVREYCNLKNSKFSKYFNLLKKIDFILFVFYFY